MFMLSTWYDALRQITEDEMHLNMHTVKKIIQFSDNNNYFIKISTHEKYHQRSNGIRNPCVQYLLSKFQI